MRVAVTGATGFVGRALVSSLLEANHRVVVLSRDPDRAARSLPLVSAHWRFSVEDGVDPAAFAGVDAVVPLAVLGTRRLVDAFVDLDSRPSVLVSASAMGVYGDRGEEELTEDAGPGADFLATVAVEWESEAARAMDYGLRVVSLRSGLVLHPDGGPLEAMLLPFRLGLGGPMGGGRQWWSWIHRADLVRLIEEAMQRHWYGALNATTPNPVRQRDFARALGRAVGRPAFAPAPAFALRLVLGEFADELLNSRRVLPARTAELGFDWKFARLEDALADLLG
jgi:uncharacterized protein (TIGR01777 family)